LLDECNVAALRLLDRHFDGHYRRIKRELFAELPTSILELGPGTGANFRYYPRGSHVVAVEPNRLAHHVLRREARRRGLTIDIIACEAEALPQETASIGVVVGTLLLCSVRDPGAVLREVCRVLRPGGRFLAVEHVAAPPASAAHAWQRRLAGVWRSLFNGCDLCRETEHWLRRADFADVGIEHFTLATPIFPIRSQIVARCTR